MGSGYREAIFNGPKEMWAEPAAQSYKNPKHYESWSGEKLATLTTLTSIQRKILQYAINNLSQSPEFYLYQTRNSNDEYLKKQTANGNAYRAMPYLYSCGYFVMRKERSGLNDIIFYAITPLGITRALEENLG